MTEFERVCPDCRGKGIVESTFQFKRVGAYSPTFNLPVKNACPTCRRRGTIAARFGTLQDIVGKEVIGLAFSTELGLKIRFKGGAELIVFPPANFTVTKL